MEKEKGGFVLINKEWKKFGREISSGLYPILKKKIPKWKQVLLTKRYFNFS